MRRPLPLAVAVLLALLVADAAQAQILGRIRDRVRDTVERELEDRSERAAEDAVEALFEAGEDAVRCLFTDAECIRRASESGQDVILTDDEGAPVDTSGTPVTEDNPEDAVVRAGPGAAAGSAAPGEGAWANYDFVPGARPLYVEDFEDDYVGNVPRRVDFQNGVMEVVDDGGDQRLRFAGASAVAFPLPETLPERFTIEFDVYSADNWNSLVLGTGPLTDDEYSCFHGDLRGHGAAEFRVGSTFKTGVAAGQTGGESLQNQAAHEEAMVPIRIAVDGTYVKMYVGEDRVANVPNADVQRTDRVLLTACGELAATDDGRAGPVLIDNVRIAAGGREVLYDALQADGRVATRGVLFATGSADLRPESTPTLQDLVRMLERHPDVRLRIEGHTDSTGQAETNLALSQRRAEAVVAFLVGRGVDAGRLEAAGLGDTQPAADNGTPEGRQQNRRVELVLL